MRIDPIEQTPARGPSTSGIRVHDLHQVADAAPENHKVEQVVAGAHYRERRQCPGLRHKEIIGWDHHLSSIQPELYCDFFHSVDRSSIDIGLAGFAQSPVAHGDAETFQHAFERSRPAIHGRGLHDLGDDEAAARPAHCCTPSSCGAESRLKLRRALCSTSTAGDTRSTSTSTVAVRLGLSMSLRSVSGSVTNSTRILPSFTSVATDATLARIPLNSARGRPSRCR